MAVEGTRVKVPGVIVMTGRTKIAAGMLAAAVLMAGCGTGTTSQPTQRSPAPAQSTAQQPPTARDTEAFLAFQSTPEWTAYNGEYQSLMKALKARDWAAATREYRHLIPAADAVLMALRATNPQANYQGIRQHLIAGVTEVRNGAQDGVNGMENSDAAKIDEANRHIDAGAKQFRQALDELDSLPG
jgi:hypothetical protein